MAFQEVTLLYGFFPSEECIPSCPIQGVRSGRLLWVYKYPDNRTELASQLPILPQKLFIMLMIMLDQKVFVILREVQL